MNAEAQNGIRVAYEANPSQQLLDFGDQFYGGQWGKLGGPYSDDVYLSNIESDGTWNYKWLGFLFRMGMGHQWPAVRLGGVQPPVMVTSNISVDLDGLSATSAQIQVTEPSGKIDTYNCSTPVCPINFDLRQGAHWFTVQYLDGSGNVLGTSDPTLLEQP